MNDSNKDLAKVAVAVVSVVVSAAAAALGIDKADKDAEKEGREKPTDRIKKWLK